MFVYKDQNLQRRLEQSNADKRRLFKRKDEDEVTITNLPYGSYVGMDMAASTWSDRYSQWAQKALDDKIERALAEELKNGNVWSQMGLVQNPYSPTEWYNPKFVKATPPVEVDNLLNNICGLLASIKQMRGLAI